MKKLLVMAAMVLSSVGAFAQYSAGDITIQPKVGLRDVSSVTENEAGYKAGFVGGVEGEYHVSPHGRNQRRSSLFYARSLG